LEVPVPKKKTDRTKKLTRRATFIEGKHLDIDRAGAPSKTLNVVKRAALNKDAPPMRAAQVDGEPIVFFKAHHDRNAASQNAVASTRLARFLGMDEIIAHNAFAKVKDVLGAVSGAVPGAKLYEVEKKKRVYLPQEYSKREIPNWMRDYEIEERKGKYYDVSKKRYQWVDFKDPKIQKGMSDLQLFDAITGQKDRHGGNIFIDPTTGQVSGIDDDKSFGNGMQVAMQHSMIISGYYRALPALVDVKTAERILALHPTELPGVLLPAETDTKELTDDEIADTVHRFLGVQLYLRDLQKRGALVGQNGTSWNDATYQQALADRTTSYLGYQAGALEEALRRSADDPTYEVVGAPQPPAPPPVPIGVDFAQILQGQPVPQVHVPPITINQPPATGLLPPAQGGPITPPTQDAVQAARARWVAVRPRQLVQVVPQGQATVHADTDESGTTASDEDGTPSSD